MTHVEILHQYSPFRDNETGQSVWYSVVKNKGRVHEIKLIQEDKPTLENLLPIINKLGKTKPHTELHKKPTSLADTVAVYIDDISVTVHDGSIITTNEKGIIVDEVEHKKEK